MDTFITYEGLPVNSGGAHSLGIKPFEEIYSDTLRFLDNFTNAVKPKELNLTFYSSQNGSYQTLPILLDLIKQFGIPSFKSWNFGTTKQRFYTWKIKQSSTKKGFQTLSKYADLPQNEYGPVVFSLKWQFQFIDLHSKSILKNQQKIPILDSRHQNSQIYLRLGQKSTISVWFAFPFSSLDEYTSNYFKALLDNLPFNPSKKHWRIWRKSKNGNWIPKVIDVIDNL